MEQITLYYRQGSSDKIYQASIEPQEDGYAVHFAYGRRGTTLQTGTKTQAPVALDEAKAILEKLIKEKTAKGYTPGEDGTPYQHTDKENQSTGIQCQLLNPVAEDEAEKLLNDPNYWMQEKMDGRRLLVQKKGDTIIGINRLGLTVGLPQTLIASASNCSCDFILDGEAIGDALHAFDALLIGEEDLRSTRYADRQVRLMTLLRSFQHPSIHVIEPHVTIGQKEEAFERFKTENAEGVVFKHIDAPYTAGRPSSGGPQLKFKFHETASFVVGKINAKRSVSLLLFAGDRIGSAGNVTIPPNHEIPQTGQVVECRYLYAFKESGCIYQPVYLGPREDIPTEECTTTQLKYKAESAESTACAK
jgi:bifunctional non-homologous end joining protein LigD